MKGGKTHLNLKRKTLIEWNESTNWVMWETSRLLICWKRRYEERELHYHQNTLFTTNQKQFYQEFDGRSNIPNKTPDAQEASEFWRNIWSIPVNFNENASWIPKGVWFNGFPNKQEDIRISVENGKAAIRKMTNWKVPGPDCVQGYWFKRFPSLHSRLMEHLQTCVLVGDVPTWMKKGKTTLI